MTIQSGKLLLPTHVEQTVQAIAALHLQHHSKLSAIQRLIDKSTRFVGRPRFAVVVTILLLSWIGFNLVMLSMGRNPIDSPPFQCVQLIAGLMSVYITVLILITQRREYQLEERRAELTLQLGF